MIFQGRIQKVFGVQSGTSANGKEWQRQDFVFEFFENPNDRFSDKVVLSALNERIKEYDLHENDEVKIGFGHRVEEYQGRMYNKIYIYQFEKVKKTAVDGKDESTAKNVKDAEKTEGEKDDDLPF